MAINEDQQQSLEEVAEMRKERIPSEPIRLESDDIFDSVVYPPPSNPDMAAFMDNPMAMLMQPLIQYFEAIKPKAFEPPKSEHKVRIFRFNDKTNRTKIAEEIEALLNDGYCCHMPTVVNDFVIMDFSRRKETEENEREQ